SPPQESASATFHRGVFDRAVDDQTRAEGILKLAFITKPAGQEMTQHRIAVHRACPLATGPELAITINPALEPHVRGVNLNLTVVLADFHHAALTSNDATPVKLTRVFVVA